MRSQGNRPGCRELEESHFHGGKCAGAAAEIISLLCEVKINSHVQWNVFCSPCRSKGAGQRLAVLADPAARSQRQFLCRTGQEFSAVSAGKFSHLTTGRLASVTARA